jgi:hypothetical protein
MIMRPLLKSMIVDVETPLEVESVRTFRPLRYSVASSATVPSICPRAFICSVISAEAGATVTQVVHFQTHSSPEDWSSYRYLAASFLMSENPLHRIGAPGKTTRPSVLPRWNIRGSVEVKHTSAHCAGGDAERALAGVLRDACLEHTNCLFFEGKSSDESTESDDRNRGHRWPLHHGRVRPALASQS